MAYYLEAFFHNASISSFSNVTNNAFTVDLSLVLDAASFYCLPQKKTD